MGELASLVDILNADTGGVLVFDQEVPSRRPPPDIRCSIQLWNSTMKNYIRIVYINATCISGFWWRSYHEVKASNANKATVDPGTALQRGQKMFILGRSGGTLFAANL